MLYRQKLAPEDAAPFNSTTFVQGVARGGVEEGFDSLPPGGSAYYAWDEPTAPHKMWVRLLPGDPHFVDMSTHEYHLDDLRVSRVVTA